MKKCNWKMISCFLITLMLISTSIWAADSTWGDIADSATGAVENIGKLITAGSYLAGLGFSIGAIMKFKQHKDNPTQVTIGVPIALTFIAAALLFLPSILSATGSTLFEGGGETAGSKGCVVNKSGKCV